MIKLILADAQNIPLQDNSVQTVITSPPYWGLRCYGVSCSIFGETDCNHEWVNKIHIPQKHGDDGIISSKLDGGKTTQSKTRIGEVFYYTCTKCGAWKGQFGLEALHDCLAWAKNESPCNECYVCHMRIIAKEIWRVLKDDGIFWLNLGDSYSSGGTGGASDKSTLANGLGVKKHHKIKQIKYLRRKPLSKLKSKNLTGIPWRVALALQADGWYLRQDIIWFKKNSLPESVKDRFTRAHEYIFMLTKKPKYFLQRIIEEADYDGKKNILMNRIKKYEDLILPDQSGNDLFSVEYERWPLKTEEGLPGRNKRSVWMVNTAQFKDAHFAVFPEKLIEPMIVASTREGDVVLDPFCGSGTTGKVAVEYNRKFVGIDKNPKFLKMAKKRLSAVQKRLI